MLRLDDPFLCLHIEQRAVFGKISITNYWLNGFQMKEKGLEQAWRKEMKYKAVKEKHIDLIYLFIYLYKY